jgi:hypothetical protein
VKCEQARDVHSESEHQLALGTTRQQQERELAQLAQERQERAAARAQGAQEERGEKRQRQVREISTVCAGSGSGGRTRTVKEEPRVEGKGGSSSSL